MIVDMAMESKLGQMALDTKVSGSKEDLKTEPMSFLMGQSTLVNLIPKLLS